MKLFDYLDKSDQKLPVLVNLVTPQGPEGWIYTVSYTHLVIRPLALAGGLLYNYVKM